LHDAQNKQALARLVFLSPNLSREFRSFQFLSAVFVRKFLFRQVVEPLANRCVASPGGGPKVKLARLDLDRFSLTAHRIQPKRPH
jgi:hypothetical protein